MLDIVSRYQEALRSLLLRTRAKCVVVDMQSRFLLSVALAHAAKQAGAVTLATTSQLLDRPGQAAFAQEVTVLAGEEGPVLSFTRPGNGWGRPLKLQGLVREHA